MLDCEVQNTVHGYNKVLVLSYIFLISFDKLQIFLANVINRYIINMFINIAIYTRT